MMLSSLRRRAFTLVEIMIVVAIAGMIFTIGVAPLMFSVRMMSETRDRFTGENRERAVFNRIAQDIREAALINTSTPVRIVDLDELSLLSRHALISLTAATAHQGLPMGNVIYAIPKDDVLTRSEDVGLRRWVLSDDVAYYEGLEAIFEDVSSQLIVPGLKGFAVQALTAGGWTDQYSGGIPLAIRVVFEYSDIDKKTFEAWFPDHD